MSPVVVARVVGGEVFLDGAGERVVGAGAPVCVQCRGWYVAVGPRDGHSVDTEGKAAMTAAVKAELSRVRVPDPSARRAELATVLRFAGAVHLSGSHIVIEAVLDSAAVAGRVRKQIADAFGYASQVHPCRRWGRVAPGGGYLLRVSKDGAGLARQAGLVDRRGRSARAIGAGGRAVIGLPHYVLTGGTGVAKAAWRGAFLAGGCLSEPGRACALELACPSVEAALALVGAVRRVVVGGAKVRHGPDGPRVLPTRRAGHRRPAGQDRCPRLGTGLDRGPPTAPGTHQRTPAGELWRGQPAQLGPRCRRGRDAS